MIGITERAVADRPEDGRRLSLKRIAAAAGVIGAEFRDSPQFEVPSIGRLFAGRLVVKVETLNPIRSFKARGAQFLMSQLQGSPHLVCVTAGNFGMGMAYAARERGCPITIFIAAGANPIRAERMRALGADVRIADGTSDETKRAAETFAAERGAMLVEDGRHAAIAEGAGTIGLEMLRRSHAFHCSAGSPAG
jgi:threonine dehydratase